MSNIQFPSIPDPGATLDGVLEAVRPLKQSVQLLVGQAGAEHRGAPRMYIQKIIPRSDHIGDLWINTDTNALSYWNGSSWIKLTG